MLKKIHTILWTNTDVTGSQSHNLAARRTASHYKGKQHYHNQDTKQQQWHTAVWGSTPILLICPTRLTCWFHLKDRIYVKKLISNITRHFVAMTTDKQIRTHGTMRQLKTSERREVGLDRKSEQTALEPVDTAVWVSGRHVTTRPGSDVQDLQYWGGGRRRRRGRKWCQWLWQQAECVSCYIINCPAVKWQC